jgi:predicted DNA-binding WGR domain protein
MKVFAIREQKAHADRGESRSDVSLPGVVRGRHAAVSIVRRHPGVSFARRRVTAAEAPGPAETRRFEFSEGTSHKYWEVSRQGVDVTVRYGRIGTQGRANVKSFADEAAAAKHAAKMVQEKIDKGYREVN